MLTAKQQFLMDTYGYVVIPNIVEPELIVRVRQAMDRMDQALNLWTPDLPVTKGQPRKVEAKAHFSKFASCITYDSSFLEMAMHPGVISCVEDIVGGPVRYEEQESSINSRDPEQADHYDQKKLGWHRGISPDFSVFQGAGRSHFLWVKAIVFLTDIGPQDGGTSVIPGTHRQGSVQELVPELEPWMVHQATGKAGSVLLFSEALIHAVTPILSDTTRYIMISGYVPRFMREYEWTDEASEAYLQTLNEQQRIFMTGDDPASDRYSFRRS